jgi:hypothetical protein
MNNGYPPAVGFWVVALHDVDVAAGGELAAADGVEVVGVGGDGKVVAGHQDVGGVAPAVPSKTSV